MLPNPQFPTDLVTFTEEILNGKHHFLCSVTLENSPNVSTSQIKDMVYGKILILVWD